MAGWGDNFRLTIVTSDPTLAATADESGVDRVGIDLEQLGKAARQAGQDSRWSGHRMEDLAAISGLLRKAEPFARVDPINPNTADDIERALVCGARALMLPYFHGAQEVETFARLVNRRASVVALVETASAVANISEILAVPGVNEIMIGLNDLRLDYGVASHFEVLVSPELDALASRIRQAGVPLAIGGVAHPDDRWLPVSPDLVLAQYPRLGATGAWVSRSFLKSRRPDENFGAAIGAIRRRLNEWGSASPPELERARGALADRVRELARLSG